MKNTKPLMTEPAEIFDIPMTEPRPIHFAPSRPNPTACEVTPLEADRCRVYPPALTMLIHLRQSNGPAPFPVVPETIGPPLCMSPGTARKARDFLLRAGLIEVACTSTNPRPHTPGRKPTVYTVKQVGEL